MRDESSKLFRISPPRLLVIGFLLIILVGSLLLSLPISWQEGKTVTYLDALFTATSATCVTGLVVVDTGTTYSYFGQMVILILIQIGGLGFMTFSTLFAIALKRRISYQERLLLMEAFNQDSTEGIIKLIRKVIIYAFTIEAVGAIMFIGAWVDDLGPTQATYFAVFHSVSLFNNAGFDLFGQVSGPFSGFTSMIHDYYVNIISMLLVVLGGIGFFVLADLAEWRVRRRLTLHSKVVLVTTGWIIAVGFVLLFLFEYSNGRTMLDLTLLEKITASFFQSVAPRTAGINTVDISQMVQASQFLIIMLMFIGAAPGSTGGGIKVTSLATIIGAVIAMVRGQEQVVMFRYQIPRERVYKAITVTFISLSTVLLAAMLLSLTEAEHPFLFVLFETTSAFATVGLTMGLTPELSVAGKIIICFIMFVGRLGPLTLAYVLTSKQQSSKNFHPEGKIII